jgi:CBS domain-containing protein
MKVKEIMTAQPRTASRDTTLAAAAQLLWAADCGILPVVDSGKLVGVVTDRDMYVALATRNAPASQLTIGEVATSKVWALGRTTMCTLRSTRWRRSVCGGCR